MSSPTQRTLKYYRDQGYLCGIVEKFNPHAKIRQDLFGVCDIVAVGKNETLCVQATSDTNLATRVTKLQGHDNTPVLKENGWKVVCIGWKKRPQEKGSNRLVWKERIHEL